jgi:peptidoglycan/LPS O-acetylase OafA/YrhL
MPILRRYSANGFVLALVLVAILAMPPMHKEFLIVVSVALVFPAMVMLGANDKPSGRAAQIAALSGALSYPVYALHNPLLWIVTGALKKFHLYSAAHANILAIPVVVGIGAFSWVVLKVYDEPVRAWLTGRFIRRQPRKELGIQPAQ